MRSFAHYLKPLIIATLVVVVLGLAVPALAQDQFGVDQAGFDILQRPDPGMGLGEFIVRIVQWILGFLAVVVVGIIAYGGFVWMTAGGNPDRVARAKKIIVNGLIGLAIILASYAIVSIIFGIFGRGGGGPNRPCPGCEDDPWRSGIGVGPIEAVYPEPDQRDVPINTWIAVTFKEEVDPASLCASTSNTSGDNAICDGEPMRNVEICGYDLQGVGGFCIKDPSGTTVADNFSADEFADTLVRQTDDNKTFVFSTTKYLGFEDFKDRVFYVHLLSGIKALATGETTESRKSIFANWGGGEYHWTFTTNGEIDLDPPEIVSTNAILNPPATPSLSGVFPNPDNLADGYRVGQPAQAKRFTLTTPSFSQIAFESLPGYTQPERSVSTAYEARVSGAYGGEQSGSVTVTLNSDDGTVRTNWPGTMTDYVSPPHDGRSQTLDIGPYGLVFNVSEGVPSRGDQWSFTVTTGATGDHVVARDGETVIKDYTLGRDIPATSTAVALTRSLAAALARDLPTVFALCATGESCTLRTTGSGEQWNRYSVGYVPNVSAHAGALQVVAVNGSNVSDIANPLGQPDVARNAVFQVTFNEPVNPVSLASALTVRYSKASATGTLVPVTGQRPEISNRYRTVEIRGTEPCGQNACGLERYCWPVNDALKANPADYTNKATKYAVEVASPRLATCVGNPNTDSWCSTWGGVCETSGTGRCVKTIGTRTVYHPLSTLAGGGVNDMSGNALNGSFNYYTDPERNSRIVGIAEGRSDEVVAQGGSGRPAYVLNNNPGYTSSTPYYSASAPSTGYGDTFAWSFWMSDRIDDQSPLLTEVIPQAGGSVRNLWQEIEFGWNKIMRSATLKPGWNYGTDARNRSIRYIVLQTITNWANPVGYWVGSTPGDGNGDGFPDWTTALVAHNRFDAAVQYGPQGGSGAEDIYQNCFLPGAGPQLGGATTCRYRPGSDETLGCVSDADVAGHTQIVDTNPASYFAIRPDGASTTAPVLCQQIAGAKVCPRLVGEQNGCKAIYATTTPARDGSWVVTQDFPWYDGRSAQGCCLGVCTEDID